MLIWFKNKNWDKETGVFKDKNGKEYTISPELMEKMENDYCNQFSLEGEDVLDAKHPTGEDGYSIRFQARGSGSSVLHADFYADRTIVHLDGYGGGLLENPGSTIQHIALDAGPYIARKNWGIFGGPSAFTMKSLEGYYRSHYIYQRKY